jgi:hypothetical protein
VLSKTARRSSTAVLSGIGVLRGSRRKRSGEGRPRDARM